MCVLELRQKEKRASLCCSLLYMRREEEEEAVTSAAEGDVTAHNVKKERAERERE